MSFECRRRISMGLSSVYFLITTLVIGYVVGYHAIISCRGVVLLLLTAPLLLYAALAHHSINDFQRNTEFVDPADFGMSIDTANLIRALGLILPLPFLAYGYFFASGLSWFALDGSPASVARTYDLVSFDERIFGHRMAQTEYRRAARIYTWKHNYGLARMFIGSAIQCAEEHTPDKPSRLVDLHSEAGRIAVRAEQWSLAECEFSCALQIAREKVGLDGNSRTVSRLIRRIDRIHKDHPESAAQPEGTIIILPPQGSYFKPATLTLYKPVAVKAYPEWVQSTIRPLKNYP